MKLPEQKKAKRHDQIKNKFISGHNRLLKQTFSVKTISQKTNKNKFLLNFMQISKDFLWIEKCSRGCKIIFIQLPATLSRNS